MGLLDLGLKKDEDEKVDNPQEEVPEGILGTGLAEGAANKLRGRKAKLQQQECTSTGGKWNSETGKCSFPGKSSPSLD